MALDGTYLGTGNRDLDPDGKAITIRSLNGPETCIIDCQATYFDNHRAFYFSNNETQDTKIQGFTIRNAWYNGDGGAINIIQASPIIDRCIFSNNKSSGGGAIYNQGYGSPVISNCIFKDHDNADIWGGCIRSENADASIVNCLFVSNTCLSGAAIAVGESSTTVTVSHCTFAGNAATTAGNAIVVYGGATLNMTDSIIWDDSTDEIYVLSATTNLTYCDVNGGWTGTGNINSNPYFASGPRGDYYLSSIPAGQLATSPCIDSGSDLSSDICYQTASGTVCMDELTTQANVALDFGTVDMGYHYPAAAAPTPTPSTCTLNGSALMQRPGVPAPHESWITQVQIVLCSADAVADEYSTTTDASGVFSVDAMPGVFDIYVKGDHTLANVQPSITLPAGGSTALIDFGTLLEGDANNDNFIVSTDFFILRLTYNLAEGDPGYDGRADFNQDGAVTSMDFFLLRASYNQAGSMCGGE